MGKNRAPHSATGESSGSSPISDRTKEILQAATWRGDGKNFVKGHTDKADVFFESSKQHILQKNDVDSN